jgi:DNA topoisomerase-1
MPKKKTKTTTGKTLIIVESPNKIKKISSYLGSSYVIRASFGHIIDLATGDKTCRLGVDVEKDYNPKYKIIPDKKDKIQSIIDAASGVDQIYLATDPDREGEAIAWHLKSCLDSTGKPIYRISFNEITKTAVVKAVNSPGPLNKDLFDAQQARRVLDRIVGFLASDFLRDAIGPNLSAGRVQSVAARLVIDRENEIENFKPEEYWNITTALAKSPDDEKFVAKYDKKITNKKDALSVKKDLDKDKYVIDKVEKKEKKRNPLPPLTTSKLQQAASTRYGFPVSKAMKAAQSLYEAGLITYMRTDSTRIAPDAIKSVRDYLSKNNLGFPGKPNYYNTKKGAQDAHEAIRPTDVFKKPQNVFLSDEQQKVYRIIWERFVACQMEPAVYDTVAVVVKSSSNHILKASGRTLKYEGWLKVASDQKSQPGEEDEMLPNLNVGDKVILVPPKVKAEQKFTQPPSRYGEATLVKELEKRGIGRPSTYANIIETIKGRSYVELKGKTYHATDIGKQVIGKLTGCYKFMDFHYTSDMEGKLDEIADGNLGYVKMLDDFFIPFQAECKKAENISSPDYGIPCPECNSKMLLKHGRYGFYMKCIDNPTCKGTVSVDVEDGKPKVKEKFQKKVVDGVDCPKCGSKGMILNDTGRFGPFYYCQNYPKCKGNRKVPYGKKCVKCGSDMFMTVFSGQKKLACMGYFESHKCRNVEDIPGEDKSGWTNPNPYRKKSKKKSVQKVLNSRSKGKKQ